KFISGKFQSDGEVVAVTDYFKADGFKAKDWAVIKLETSAPKNWKLNPIFVKKIKEVGRRPVDVAGFMSDIPTSVSGEELWGEKNCKIWGKGSGDFKGTWVTDCAGIPGASGSPIFSKILNENNNPEFVVYGVMSSV